jgi:hypothetical protein
MPDRISFDTETFLFTPGLLIPPGVVGSFCDGNQEWVEPISEALETLAGCLRPGVQIEGAKIDYDTAVACNERPDLTPEIFAHYDRQGFYDVQIAQALDAVARGHLFQDPDSRGPLRTAPAADGTPGKVTNRYSLGTCVWLVLQRRDAKDNAEFRLRYGELSKLPMAEWPAKATVYPGNDARNTFDVATVQRQTHRNLGALYRVRPNAPPEQWEPISVEWYERPGVPRTRATLTHVGLNTYAAFALHLLSAWGLRVDPVALKALRVRCTATAEAEQARFYTAGLLKADGKKNNAEIKRQVIRAYRPRGEPERPCEACAGTGRVKSLVSGNLVNCKACDATGLTVPLTVPVTAGGGISADRDCLRNSGNDLLSDFGQSTNAKILTTYLPFLEQGIAGPINVGANVLLETGRVSFGKGDADDAEAPGLLQTFPRSGGVRETIVAPDGWCMCSNDWNALEFANLGQAQKLITGRSPILDSINSGKDPHSILGAKMLDIGYDEFRTNLAGPATRKAFNAIRQGTKAGNFGFGGRMGPAKFAYTQRKQQIAGHGSMCRLMHREPEGGCGSVMLDTWKKRPLTNKVCESCVIVSEELRLSWLDLWELKDLFNYVDGIDGIQDGQGEMITPGTGYIRGGLNVSAGCNQTFQHLGAYGAKLALIAISRECYVDRGTALFGCRPIIMAHDEVITLMPLAYAAEAAQRQTELMQWAMSQICPDATIGIEPALMRRWYKSAEAYWLDPACPECKGTGWIFGVVEGKETRSQCKPCKRTGKLSPWEPQ